MGPGTPKLTRYVFWQLLVGTLLLTASLTAVVWLAQSLRFVEMIVNRGLSTGTFVYLVGLLLPNFLVIIVPFAFFATTLFVYNRMIQDRELVVMRAAGLSQWALARPALLLALTLTFLSYGLHLYLTPLAEKAFKDLRWEIRNGYSYIVLQEGTFNTFANNITVYIRERTKDGELLGILARDARDPAKPFTLMAERGALVSSDEGTRIVLQGGNRQEVDRKTNKLSILYFDKYSFDMGLQGGGRGPRQRDSGEMFVHELFNIEQFTYIDERDHGTFKVVGHNRLTAPLYNLAFGLIALAAMISGGFTRRTTVRRIVAATVLVILVQLGAMGTENIAAKNLGLVPLIYMNAIIPILLGGYIMMRGPLAFRPGKPSPLTPEGT